MAKLARHSDSCTRLHCPGYTETQTHTGVFQPPSECFNRPPSQTCISDSHNQRTSSLVDSVHKRDVGHSSPTPTNRGNHGNGLQSQGLWRSLSDRSNTRSVDRRRSSPTYKLQGIKNNSHCPPTLVTKTNTQICDDLHRQCFRSELRQSHGRHSQSTFTNSNRTDLGTGHPEQHVASSSSHKIERQRHCRLSVAKTPDPLYRMESSPSNNPQTVQSVGYSDGGHVRQCSESQTSTLLQSPERPLGGAHRCPLMELGQPVRIRVPPTKLGPASVEQTAGPPKLYYDSDLPEVGENVVLSTSDRTTDGHSYPTSPHSENAETAPSEHFSPSPPPSTTSRLETVVESLLTTGFSEESADRISHKYRDSTQKLYNAQWEIYTTWCRERGVNPRQPTSPMICDFFNFLVDSQHLTVSTLKGYRTVLNKTFRFVSDYNIIDDQNVTDLLDYFTKVQPVARFQPPKWDLSVVLLALIKRPFEPIWEIPLKLLTYKTVFLVALATATRTSELHALDARKFVHNQDWSAVWLEPRDDFLAKNQKSKENSRVFKIQSLSEFAGDLDDRKLCPVRALRMYREKTSSMRKDRKNLFISFSPKTTTDIGRSTIASYLKRTIILAHDLIEPNDCQLLSVNAHEVRAIAASTAFHKNISITELLANCTWKNHNVFTNFYLRDVACSNEYEYLLPRYIVAGHTVNG